MQQFHDITQSTSKTTANFVAIYELCAIQTDPVVNINDKR